MPLGDHRLGRRRVAKPPHRHGRSQPRALALTALPRHRNRTGRMACGNWFVGGGGPLGASRQRPATPGIVASLLERDGGGRRKIPRLDLQAQRNSGAVLTREVHGGAAGGGGRQRTFRQPWYLYSASTLRPFEV